MDDPFAGAIQAAQPAAAATNFSSGDDPFAGAIPGNASAEQAGPPQQQLGFSDVPGQLWQGIRHGIGDIGQTFGAEGMEGAPGAAPYEWSDIIHPGSALSKTAYRLGEGAPTLGAGIAGGAAGSGLAGPVGGIAGGALGAAGMSALQTLGPAFARELRDNPGNPDAAWNQAVKSAVTSGAFSGAAWAAFPMRFFEGPIKNAAFQIFGVQPGLAVGHQAAENVAHERPALEGAGEAFAEGAVGSALPMVGTAATRGIARATGLDGGATAARQAAAKAASGEPPTAEELENIANQHYGDIEHRNIRYTNIDELEAVQRNIRDMLYKAGADPRTEKRVFDAVDSLAESRRGPGAIPDWSDIEHARKMLNNAMGDRDPATRRAAALAIHDERNGLDAWIENPQAQVRAGVDPVLAHDLADKAALARSYWRASKGMEAFDRIVEKANNSSNAREVTFRNEIRKVVNDPRKHWQYPPEAIALMQEGLHRGFWQAAAHASKLFDPHSSFGLFTNFMSHSMFGPEGLLAMPAAMGLRYIGQRPLKRVEERVPRMIGAQPTGLPWQGPSLRQRIGARTAAHYTPYVGPMAPQQRQEGGEIDTGALPSPLQQMQQSIDPNASDDYLMQKLDRNAERDRADDVARQQWLFYRSVAPEGANVPPPRLYDERRVQRGGAIGKALRLARRADGGDVDQPLDIDMTSAQPIGSDPFSRHMTAINQLGSALTPEWSKPFAGMTPQQGEAEARTLANPDVNAAGKIGPGYLSDTQRFGEAAGDIASWLAPEAKGAMMFAAPKGLISKATKMLKEGASNRDIWQQLNAFRDVAGNWRTEALGPTKLKVSPEEIMNDTGRTYDFRDLVDAPHVWNQAGTKISKLPVETRMPNSKADAATMGYYQPYTHVPGPAGLIRPNTYSQNPYIWLRPYEYGSPLSSEDLLSTLYHEGQHAIDQRAGFLHRIGGDPNWMKNAAVSDPIYQHYQQLISGGLDPRAAANAAEFERYKRSFHEVAARTSARRADMYNFLHETSGPEIANEWAREEHPRMTEDVARPFQLIGAKVPKRRGGVVGKALRVAKHGHAHHI